jgi:hypothetical protein
MWQGAQFFGASLRCLLSLYCVYKTLLNVKNKNSIELRVVVTETKPVQHLLQNDIIRPLKWKIILAFIGVSLSLVLSISSAICPDKPKLVRPYMNYVGSPTLPAYIYFYKEFLSGADFV